MDERKELVSYLATLWKKHKEREALYLAAMKIDNLGKLRKLCSQGYSISLLFQREIKAIYNSFRCNFDDLELCNHCTEHLNETIKKLDNGLVLSSILVEYEMETLRNYEITLSYLDETNEEGRTIVEHISLLSEVANLLQKLNKVAGENTRQDEPLTTAA